MRPCGRQANLVERHGKPVCDECVREICDEPKCAICGLPGELVPHRDKFVCVDCKQEISAAATIGPAVTR